MGGGRGEGRGERGGEGRRKGGEGKGRGKEGKTGKEAGEDKVREEGRKNGRIKKLALNIWEKMKREKEKA